MSFLFAWINGTKTDATGGDSAAVWGKVMPVPAHSATR